MQLSSVTSALQNHALAFPERMHLVTRRNQWKVFGQIKERGAITLVLRAQHNSPLFSGPLLLLERSLSLGKNLQVRLSQGDASLVPSHTFVTGILYGGSQRLFPPHVQGVTENYTYNRQCTTNCVAACTELPQRRPRNPRGRLQGAWRFLKILCRLLKGRHSIYILKKAPWSGLGTGLILSMWPGPTWQLVKACASQLSRPEWSTWRGGGSKWDFRSRPLSRRVCAML